MSIPQYTIELAEAFERAADRPDYAWLNTGNCNCGLPAQELLNISGEALISLKRSDGACGCWSDASNIGFCPVTGTPICRIFILLAAPGLKKKDFYELEHLSNPAVLKRMGLSRLPYNNHENFRAYARTFATMIREQHEINRVAQMEIQKAAPVASVL